MDGYKELKLNVQRIQGLWDLLPAESQQRVEETVEVHRFLRGDKIYCEGDAPSHLLCVMHGNVKIFRHGSGGRDQIVRLLQPGQYFGYRAYFGGAPYVTAAAAFDESIIACIPMEVIEDAMMQSVALCRFFVKELAVDLGQADARLVSLTQKHIRGRLAESLLMLGESYGYASDGCTINIEVSREDLAQLSNMTTSNAIRTLSDFVQEGIVQVEGRRITVRSFNDLRHASRIG